MIRFLAFIFILLPVVSFALPVRVQTGEHANFTRVVLTIDRTTRWEVRRDVDAYVVQLSTNNGFDLSRFFDLIPRDRIMNATQDGEGALRLGVTCRCRVDAFLFRPDILVVDILDGSPSVDSPFERPITGTESVNQKNLPTHQYALPPNAILPVIMHASDEIPPFETPQLPIGTGSVDDTEPAVPGVPEEDLASLEQAITQSLARGLTQGVLAADLPNKEQAQLLDLNSQQYFTDNPSPMPGLLARTSTDPRAIPDTVQDAETQTGQSCLPDSFFAVADWSDDRPFSDQLTEARNAITTAADRYDENAILRLARIYMAFGFGREAIRTLELDGTQSQERLYLAQMARIVDGENVESDLFTAQVSCQSNVAFWAMLATRDGALDAQMDRSAVLNTFKMLPPRLQRYLGPRLSDRLVAVGDQDGARQALEAARGGETISVDVILSEATLNHAIGEDDRAKGAITELARDNARVTPEAFIRFFDQATENDQPLNPEDFLLADALRFENANMPVAGDLAGAQIRALLAKDDIAAARALIAAEGKSLSVAQVTVFDAAIVDTILGLADDTLFLEHVLSEDLPDVSAGMQNALARRVLALGFPEEAGALLKVPANGPDAVDRLLLRADIARVERGASNVETAAAEPAFGELQAVQAPISLTDAPLAQSRALLDASTQTREELNRVLDQFIAPESF